MLSRSIEQWYKWATNLNRYWRESKREEKRLRDRRETRVLTSRMNTPAVVATTRHSRTNDLTTSKALSRLSSNKWGITRELDKEPSLYCSSFYITYKWSVLQQCVYLMSYYLSTCVFLKATMLSTCALTLYL